MNGQPNVVLVITDDQGYGDLGCLGSPFVRSPHIDAFHSDSVRMTNYHVGPTCAPTRSGLLTGHYANSTGVWHTIGGRSLLRSDEWTLATALSESGYVTGIFGKWHLGDASPYRPHERGFDKAVVHGGGGIGNTPDYWGNDYFADTYFENGSPRRFSGYCTEVWFDLAIEFIEENRDVPFFCYLPTNAPHSPYNVPARYFEMYRGEESEQMARFHGMVTCIDENFGRLREHLQLLGIEDKTILVFMTDNGTSAGVTVDNDQHVVDGYNAGMRGKKGSEYEGGHRVPFFMRYPDGGIYGGIDVNRIAANIDFMPTILELCGVVIPPDRSFHGQSLVPLISSTVASAGSTGSASLFAEWPDRTIVTDSQRVAQPIKWKQSAVMTDRWRLVNGSELYDIDNDPGQRRDVASKWPRQVERLRSEYEAWWNVVSAQFGSLIPIPLGTRDEPTTLLTSHDMRNPECDVAWNQGMVRRGHLSVGYWEVLVEHTGKYKFELRRWPRELDRAIDAGISDADIEWRRDDIPEESRFLYSGGRALPITHALLRVGKIAQTLRLASGAHAAFFVATLEAGPTTLEAMYSGDGFALGAYYVYVSLVDGDPKSS